MWYNITIFEQYKSLKGNCSGKKKNFFIPSIDRVCGSDAQEKKSDFLHSSVMRYKTLRSSTNCGCGHLMGFVHVAERKVWSPVDIGMKCDLCQFFRNTSLKIMTSSNIPEFFWRVFAPSITSSVNSSNLIGCPDFW